MNLEITPRFNVQKSQLQGTISDKSKYGKQSRVC